MNAPPGLEQLEFQRGPHVYMWRGRPLLSVTQIMRAHQLGFQGFAPQSALDRGNYCHEAFPLIGAGELEWSTVPADYLGYCRGAERFFKDTGTRLTHSELPLVHPELGYAGTFDGVGIQKGERVLFEVKTGDASDWDVQAAGYLEMWKRWFPELEIRRAEGVKLNADGTYRREDLNVSSGWNAFASCLVLESRLAGRRRAA